MSDDELMQIRERVKKATKGPWIEDHNTNGWQGPIIIGSESTRRKVADIAGLDNLSYGCATFIAHARADIPALLAHIERLTEAAEYAVNILSGYRGHPEYALGTVVEKLDAALLSQQEPTNGK